MSSLGFIMLRHVNNELTNKYWNHCYECIRKYYPENLILIVDDNSNYEYVAEKQPLYKTTIINSEYPGRGELLPYFYYLHNKLFDTAFIIHDSVFVNQRIDFSVDKYKMLWNFKHNWDQIEDETNIINVFNDVELLNFHKNKTLWKGCFGCMTIVKHDFLTFVNTQYDISKLLDVIKMRYNRCSFERVISCLFQSCLLQKNANETLLGDIHDYYNRSITFEEKDYFTHLPLTKVWTGR